MEIRKDLLKKALSMAGEMDEFDRVLKKSQGDEYDATASALLYLMFKLLELEERIEVRTSNSLN